MKRKTIKQVVFDFVRKTNGKVEYSNLAEEVLAHDPKSAWKPKHWSWYKAQIIRGKYTGQFADEILENLKNCSSNHEVKDPKAKQIGDRILNDIRARMDEAAGGDVDLRFRINRWIFARMQQEEVRAKTPVKQTLWANGIHRCQNCLLPYKSIKNLECHRVDGNRAYSVDNCVLLCRTCHENEEKKPK